MMQYWIISVKKGTILVKLSHRFMIIFSSALLVGITLMALTIYSNFEMTRTKYVDDMYVSIESIIDNYFNREIEETGNHN